MKLINKISAFFAAAVFAVAGLSSCSDDDLGATIFDSTYHPLDRTAYSFPLDTFLYKNYLEPYNLRFLYKMEDIGSDLEKNLIPCSYDKSLELAVLAKYLWFDVYKECVSEEFLKIYSPRIIHVIGSPSYNAASGSETLGTAEGGLKITLYNGNNFDANDIDMINEKFFKTMHHEFSHILHQNYSYPTDFGTISSGQYNLNDWQNSLDSMTLSTGFVTPYASSQVREDWVETIANYIVKDYDTWNNMINTASFGWEKVQVDKSTFDRLNGLLQAGLANADSVGYRTYGFRSGYDQDVKNPQGNIVTYEVLRKTITRDENDNPVVVDGKMQYTDDGIDGQEIILRKLEMTKNWLRERFNIDLDKIRREVQRRQYLMNDDDTYVYDSNGKPINRITYQAPGEEKTLLETLKDEVFKYKELQVQQ